MFQFGVRRLLLLILMSPIVCRPETAIDAPTLHGPSTADLGVEARRIPESTSILYSTSYYSEYMPYERLDQDITLMKRAGINVVRMGESTWSLWEPQDGRFDYLWMDRVVDAMGEAHIKVILGTPTYSIPPWL